MKVAKQQIRYRLFEERDTDNVLRLWKEESGWGGISLQQFNEWYFNTPYGNCLIVVAADEEDNAKGQIVLSPSRLLVEGKEVKSLRATSPILDRSLRQGTLQSETHPAYRLIEKSVALAAEEGYQYIYSFPAYGWQRLLQRFSLLVPNPIEVTSYKCFALSLTDAGNKQAGNSRYSVMPVKDFTREHEDLWQEAAMQWPLQCGIHRHYKWLNWVSGDHLKLEIRTVTNRHLLGYISIKKDGLISDLMARNAADLKVVFQSALQALHRANQKAIPVPFHWLKGMMTAETKAMLQGFVFQEDPYRFGFFGCLLNSKIRFEKIHSSQWYMTPLG